MAKGVTRISNDAAEFFQQLDDLLATGLGRQVDRLVLVVVLLADRRVGLQKHLKWSYCTRWSLKAGLHELPRILRNYVDLKRNA